MILGALLLIGLFTLYPYAYALWASVQNLSPIMPTSFAGLKNYTDIFTSTYFVGAVRTTLVFAGIAVPLILLMGIAAAALLNQSFIGNVVLKGIVLLPWAIPAAITGIIWKGLFNDSWGAVNASLYKIGLIGDYTHWLTTPTLAMLVAILAQVWTQFPLAALLLLAAMQSIPTEQFESAAIDGASTWQRFRFVTLPSIKGTLVIIALYEFLVGLTTFDLIFSLTGGGPGTATTVIGYFIWAETFKMLSFGRGAALAVILALASLVIIFVMLRVLPRDAFLEQRS
jgi:ABC-type sugar transport system permease subunit